MRRMIMNIDVGNLSYHATEETIRQAFESFGQVISARIIKDKYTGQSKEVWFCRNAGAESGPSGAFKKVS